MTTSKFRKLLWTSCSVLFLCSTPALAHDAADACGPGIDCGQQFQFGVDSGQQQIMQAQGAVCALLSCDSNDPLPFYPLHLSGLYASCLWTGALINGGHSAPLAGVYEFQEQIDFFRWVWGYFTEDFHCDNHHSSATFENLVYDYCRDYMPPAGSPDINLIQNEPCCYYPGFARQGCPNMAP